MMRLALALLALLTLGASPVDWTKTVTRAPTGAYVLGNPNAKVRLVEYLSYSCPHCAHFAAASAQPLRAKYIAKGSLAVEFRNAVRDRYDLAASILARCGGPARFHAQSAALFGAQDDLLTRAQAHEASNPPRDDAPLGEVLTGMARGSGMVDLLAKDGLAPAAAQKCLTDKATQDVVLGMTKEAWEVRKISFTPAFFINNRDAGPNDWATLEPKLRAALGLR